MIGCDCIGVGWRMTGFWITGCIKSVGCVTGIGRGDWTVVEGVVDVMTGTLVEGVTAGVGKKEATDAGAAVEGLLNRSRIEGSRNGVRSPLIGCLIGVEVTEKLNGWKGLVDLDVTGAGVDGEADG